MTLAPPELLAPQVMVACGDDPLAMPVTLTAEEMVGVLGRVAGTRFELADDADPVPLALVALTVKVYVEPAVRPEVMVQEVPDPVQVAPPGLAVAVYVVMAEPPVLAGALQLTTACGLVPKAMSVT